MTGIGDLSAVAAHRCERRLPGGPVIPGASIIGVGTANIGRVLPPRTSAVDSKSRRDTSHLHALVDPSKPALRSCPARGDE